MRKESINTSKLGYQKPHQDRSVKTEERIVAAMEHLLRKKSFAEISLNEIVARAKTTTGSFYARFKSKEALLSEIYRRYSDDIGQAIQEALHKIDWTGLERSAAVETCVRYAGQNSPAQKWLMRAVSVFARMHPGLLPQGAYDRSQEHYRMGEAALMHHVPSNDPNVCRRRARVATFAMVTLLRERMVFDDAPLAQALDVPNQEFETEVAKMISAYLAMGDGKAQR